MLRRCRRAQASSPGARPERGRRPVCGNCASVRCGGLSSDRNERSGNDERSRGDRFEKNDFRSDREFRGGDFRDGGKPGGKRAGGHGQNGKPFKKREGGFKKGGGFKKPGGSHHDGGKQRAPLVIPSRST